MARNLLLEGISDALGFIGGALAGFWVGRLLGWNIFAAGYGNESIGHCSGGLGRWLGVAIGSPLASQPTNQLRV
jgi:hypothetical protein